MEIVTNKPVLVTGANGFLGAHIVSQLLARGYSVRAIIRPISEGSDESEITARVSEFVSTTNAPGSYKSDNISALFSPYAKLSGINEQLELVEADLTSPDMWESAFTGVEYVIHTAAPNKLQCENPQSEFMQPVVEGTRRLLELSQQSGTVKKFIYISCLSALTDEFDSIKEYSERDWNTTSSLERNPSAFSKTTAEKLVFSFTEQVGCRFSAVSILPGMLWGPPVVGHKLSFSHRFLSAFLNGSAKFILNLNYNLSDVRDVAGAVILAMEQPRLTGRFCLCNEAMHLQEVLQIIHESFEDIPVPTRRVRDFVMKIAYANDKSDRGEFLRYHLGRKGNIRCLRALEAGMMQRPPVQTILDTTRYLLEHGLLEPPPTSHSCVIH